MMGRKIDGRNICRRIKHPGEVNSPHAVVKNTTTREKARIHRSREFNGVSVPQALSSVKTGHEMTRNDTKENSLSADRTNRLATHLGLAFVGKTDCSAASSSFVSFRVLSRLIPWSFLTMNLEAGTRHIRGLSLSSRRPVSDGPGTSGSYPCSIRVSSVAK
jgi:hypothetical protein